MFSILFSTAKTLRHWTKHSVFENETASSEWSGWHWRQVHAKWRSDEACRAPRGSRSKAPAILPTPSISAGPVTPFPLAGIRFWDPGMRPRYSNGVSACVTRLLVAEQRDNLIFIGRSCRHSRNTTPWHSCAKEKMFPVITARWHSKVMEERRKRSRSVNYSLKR